MSLLTTAILLAVSLAMTAIALMVARRPVEIGRIRPPTTPFLFVGVITTGLLAMHLLSLLLNVPVGGVASSP
jgi:hypothetical protein